MKLRVWNRNFVGTHYGGSLYSMADPFYMLMLIENFGHNYTVWDKSATVRFRKPGRGKVAVNFRLRDGKVVGIRHALVTPPKVEPVFVVEVTYERGFVNAEVQ